MFHQTIVYFALIASMGTSIVASVIFYFLTFKGLVLVPDSFNMVEFSFSLGAMFLVFIAFIAHVKYMFKNLR